MSEKSTRKSSDQRQADLMQLHHQLQEGAARIERSDPSFKDWLRTPKGPTLVSGESRMEAA